jgi:sec-independent protein translocase protein TatB
MFGLGMMELVVIAIVALLVVGPDKLPDAAKKISRGIRDFRKQTRELGKTLDDDTELGSAVRDLKSALRGDDFTRPPPRPPAPPAPPEKADEGPSDTAEPVPVPEAEEDGTPIVKLAAGAVAKGEHASDPDEDPNEDPNEDDEPHEDTTSGKAHG